MVSFNRNIFQYVHASQSVYPDLILVIAVYSVPSKSLSIFKSETDFLLQFCHNIIRSSFVCIWLQHVLLCQTMCHMWEADSAPLWLQFLALDHLVHFQCVYFSWEGIQPLTNFYRKLIVCGVFLEQLCSFQLRVLNLAYHWLGLGLREAQKIMNRNSLQSCTLSSGEIGEYITAVMVLLACSKEYLTLLAPVT